MSFISYAQNYEDVMLWRALKHLQKGFYIDIGAYSPSTDSVTKAFYNAGWRGINIEPNPVFIKEYNDERSEDINLSVAISGESGEAEMFFVSNPGLSSLNQEIAEGHRKLGWTTTPSTVKVRTLKDVCEEYCLGQEIHFLKIDIEGLEEQALKGNDWLKFRPWIVVVEATLPMSQVENYKDWEPILLEANYIFAYADGLNRFYLSKEHKELLPLFKYPPNVFDEFRHSRELDFEHAVRQAEARAEQIKSQAVILEEQVKKHAEHSTEQVKQLITAREQKLVAEARNEQLQQSVQSLEAQVQRQAELTTERVEQLITAREQKSAAEARNEQLQQSIQKIEQQLAAQTDTLNQLRVEANEQQAQAQAHAQWLQNEWDAAKEKVAELNASSHHWWLESERLNKELKAVYRSKSWVITWPLRKLMQFFKLLFLMPAKLVLWLIRFPKRAVRWVIVKLMDYVIKRPKLTKIGLHVLRKYPKLKSKLRLLEIARGILLPEQEVNRVESVSSQPKNEEMEVEKLEEVISDVDSESKLLALTPDARRIYTELKQTIEKNRKES